MEKKSILTPVLSVVLAVLILGSAFIVGIKGGFFSKDKDNKADNEDTITEFKFEGFNDSFNYLSATAEKISDVLSGKVDTGISSELTIIPGDIIAKEMGVSSLGNLKITTDGKVKGGMSANDIYLDYNDQRIISLKTVTDETNVYFQIPELSDAYVSGDVKEFLTEATGVHSEYLYNDGTSVDIPDDMKAALEAFDEEKIEKLLNTYLNVIADNVPEGKSNGEIVGDINGVSYKYSKSKITITEEDMLNFMKHLIKELKNDKELEDLFNSFMDANRNRLKEIYKENYDEVISDEELDEYYPYYQTILEEYQKELDEAEVEDVEIDDPDSLSFDLYYDKDGNVKGFGYNDDGDVMSVVYVDESDKFAVEYVLDDGYEVIKADVSIIGSDGKYDAAFYLYDDNDVVMAVTVNSDTEIVDKETGAFKGDIDVAVTADNETLTIKISSDSTADKTDLTVTAAFEGENIGTLKFVAVETGASDITVPSGIIYNAMDQEDIDKYLESFDIEGLETKLKTALGDELFEMFFDDGLVAGYNYEIEQQRLSSNAKSVYIAVNDACSNMIASGDSLPDKTYEGEIDNSGFGSGITDYDELIQSIVYDNTDEELLGAYYVIVIENGLPRSVYLYGDNATGIYHAELFLN